MKQKLLLLITGILSVTFMVEAQQTKLLTAEKHNEYGLVYYLPVTAFRVEVVAVKEVEKAGPFSKYSKIFTKDASVVAKDGVKWSIEKISVTPYGVADTENKYLMQLKPGATTFIGVDENGMLLSINKEVKLPQKEEISITQIEGVPVTGKEYLEFVNEDFIAAGSSYKQAQLLAQEIMEVRDAKLSLTRGTAETMPTDGRQLELMLESLEKQEKALTNAFTGATWKERVVRTYSFIPEDAGKAMLFKLDPEEGPVNANHPNGKPVYVTVSVVNDGELPVDAKGDEKKIPKDAVIYCVPGVGKVSIGYEGSSLFQKDYPMSQFGFNFGLNPTVFTDKKEPSYAVFDPNTGALLELGTLK